MNVTHTIECKSIAEARMMRDAIARLLVGEFGFGDRFRTEDGSECFYLGYKGNCSEITWVFIETSNHYYFVLDDTQVELLKEVFLRTIKEEDLLSIKTPFSF